MSDRSVYAVIVVSMAAAMAAPFVLPPGAWYALGVAWTFNVSALIIARTA